MAAVGAVLAAAGWRADEPPSGTGAQRERWENVAALMRLAREAVSDAEAAGAARADSGELHRRARRAGRGAARADGRRRHPRVAARRQGPGVGRGLPGRAWWRGCSRSATPPRPRRWRRSAGCFTSASPGPGATSRCPGRRRARPAGVRASPRRFLDGSRAGCVAQHGGAPRSKRSGPPAAVDPQLWEALRQWRSQQAAEQKQPAYCVFTDATLEAIASKRPATLQQLRAGARSRMPPSSSASDRPCSMSFRRQAKAPKLRAIAAATRFSARHEKCRRNKYVACAYGAPLG